METSYMNRLCIFFPLSFGYISAIVRLHVVEKEIQLGKPLHLSCEILNDEIKYNRKWFGGKDSSILCFNGVSSNPKKYTERQLSPRQYLLKIDAVTGNDLNYPYACRFGFLTDDITLSVNESNFKYLPTENTTHVSYVLEKGIYSLQVRLDQVFPVPTCKALTNPKPRKLTVADKRRNGILYAVKFSDLSKEPFHTCGSPLKIECPIKDREYTITRLYSFECSGVYPSLPRNSTMTVIGIVSGTVIVIILAVYIIYRKKRRKENYHQTPSA